MHKKELELIPQQLYFTTSNNVIQSSHRFISMSIGVWLTYIPVGKEYGPYSIGQCFKFFSALQKCLRHALVLRKQVLLYTNNALEAKTNAILLVALFRIMIMNERASIVQESLASSKPHGAFFDVSGKGFELSVFDFLAAGEKLRNLYEFQLNKFSQALYDFNLHCQHGELCVILPHRLQVFSYAFGAVERASCFANSFDPYYELFEVEGVEAVIRTCSSLCSGMPFPGIKIYNLQFKTDNDVPSEAQLIAFFSICQRVHGLLALESDDGWGVVGTLVCCYLIRFMRMRAREAIAAVRLYRPGAVIGAQQEWLCNSAASLANETCFVERRRFYDDVQVSMFSDAERRILSAESVNQRAHTFINSPPRRLRAWDAAEEIEQPRDTLMSRPMTCGHAIQLTIKAGHIVMPKSAVSSPTRPHTISLSGRQNTSASKNSERSAESPIHNSAFECKE